jgi:hypothetical protein
MTYKIKIAFLFWSLSLLVQPPGFFFFFFFLLLLLLSVWSFRDTGALRDTTVSELEKDRLFLLYIPGMHLQKTKRGPRQGRGVLFGSVLRNRNSSL